MLDSVNAVKMLPTVAATVALATAKPIASEDDATKISIATVKTQTQTTPTKAKTIFNWFRGTKYADSSEPIYANNANNAKRSSVNVDATNVAWPRAPNQRAQSLPPITPDPPDPSAPAPADVTWREFRGVQSLRHLWNKRISASEDATRRSKSLAASKANKLNKSHGCLVQTSNLERADTANNVTAAITVQKRAQSLHDCTLVGAEAVAEAASRAKPERTIARELDCVHREKDNFYKYKTAEQAAKHLAREARVRSKTHRLTAGIVSGDATQEDTNFPATHSTAKGERIHWLKRQDIVLRRNNKHRDEQRQLEVQQQQQQKEKSELQQEMAIKQRERQRENAALMSAAALPLSATDIVINAHPTPNTQPNQRQQPPTKLDTTTTKQSTILATHTCIVGNDADSEALTAPNSPLRNVSRKRTAQREATNSNSSSKRGSPDSNNATEDKRSADSATSPVTSSGRTTRRTQSTSSLSTSSQSSNSAAAAARKYSFKTHTRSYHAPRKMSIRDNVTGAGLVGSGGSSGVSVAKLTQQFNEMIQKDKKLLQEVKRKNGVLMARGGHIYKVVEKTSVTEGSGAKKSSSTSSVSPSISRNSSRAKDVPLRASMVQRNIKKFESGVDMLYAMDTQEQQQKPAVPAKSAEVLRKLREHNKLLNPNMLLPPPLHPKLELKKAQLTLPLVASPLEVVTEESKTPLEAYEKSLAVEQAPIKQMAESANGQVSTMAARAISEMSFTDEKSPMIVVTDAPTVNSATVADGHPVEAIGLHVVSEEIYSIKHGKCKKNNVSTDNGCVYATLESLTDDAISAESATPAIPTNAFELELATPAATVAAENEDEAVHPALVITAVVSNTVATTASESDLDELGEEKAKQRKNKYAKIYEKFRFRSPFGSGQNKKQSPNKTAITEVTTPDKATPPALTAQPMESDLGADVEPAAKILDALHMVDEKLKDLAEARNDCSIVLSADDEFEQRVLPNSSFVYQANTRQVANNQLIVTQAVNVTLVNSIESEQMVMEQKSLEEQLMQVQEQISLTVQQIEKEVMLSKPSPQLLKAESVVPQKEEEPMYEPIAETKTEYHNYQTITTSLPQSFIFKSSNAAASKSYSETTQVLADTPALTTATHSELSTTAALSNDTTPLTTPVASTPTTLLDEIYQTVEEAKSTELPPTAVTTGPNQLSDYESIAGSCEQSLPANVLTPKPLYDGYEICEPPPDAPASLPPLPALSALPTVSASMLTLFSSQHSIQCNVRNTNDELPELPKPKRRLPKSPVPDKNTSTTSQTAASHDASSGDECPPNTSNHTPLDDNDDHHYYADDENIYDTIKGSHCYESLHAESLKSQKSTPNGGNINVNKNTTDNISLSSNCYESISHYRRSAHPISTHIAGSNSGSTLTISSDHKTNSLYEMSMTTSGLYGTAGGSVSGYRQVGMRLSKASSVCGMSSGSNNSGGGLSDGGNGTDAKAHNTNYCHSSGVASDDAGGAGTVVSGCQSDNSDEWVDISDVEAEQQFIVVRERCNKVHRSPDWSRRVRDKRLHQKKAFSCIEDDSDHYYETLSPLSNKRHPTQIEQSTNNHHKHNEDLPKCASRTSQRSRSYYAHNLGTSPISDDYDSFDTDTDEIYEGEENMKNHNDSGVDISNVKLPDPPPATNQVYAIVRKLKNFISNKKSPATSSNKYGGSQQKLYENASQFYVNSNIYENSPKIKAKSNKLITATTKKSKAPALDDNIYENAEFHTPPKMNLEDKPQFSTSEKNLSTATTVKAEETAIENANSSRAKPKSAKSFKSRLRKSLAGASFDTKHFSTLTPTRSTFYIDDPSYGGSGELDSGFSEKASSCDLPTTSAAPTPETQKFSTVARKAKKDTKLANTPRRRTTIGIRPMEPPPPPPAVAPTSMTSWYTECGVFKQVNGNHEPQEDLRHISNGSKSNQNGSSQACSTSWYTEAGLYQTSGVSVASSSGSSGVSTGNEGTQNDDMSHSFFQNEPLYQIYNAAKLESITRDMEDHDSSIDGYEEVGQNARVEAFNPYVRKRRPRPSAYQLIEPKNGPARTLWSEIPEVINSCILPSLTPRERCLQEAKFEIITSEASYLKSLNLLRSHFMNHPIFHDNSVVSAQDRKALFAHILPVHECSELLLTQLETCWQDNIMLLGLSRHIYAIAEKHFHVYIAYCEDQGRMDRTLRRLKDSKGAFSQNLDLLETSPICYGLNLHSFLMLPMQRITRLPLLIDAVFNKVSPNDDEYESWKMTLAIMNKIVAQCNEAANRCEQAYEIERIARQLEFPVTIRALAIAPVGVSTPGSKPRFLVRKGELTHLIWRGDDVKLTFGKKFTKSIVYAFLFSDLLVLTKRKAEEQFTVFDYCPRSMLTITSGDLRDISQTHKNLILMTLLENHERKTVELVLSCPSVSEQERWLQAARPPQPETPGEKLYESWDCPQVIAKHTYEINEPDALALEVGDVVNVTRKLPDGWYHGERLRDGASGWFPGSYTEEVNSAHVRARNLKQRQRLLTFTATYLESQKRK